LETLVDNVGLPYLLPLLSEEPVWLYQLAVAWVCLWPKGQGEENPGPATLDNYVCKQEQQADIE
jgi:hypothetical protein